jgi:LacI family transcriptional regulator
MARKPVTLQEVADITGVSRATVSAVLNGRDWVSEATRARVQSTLREVKYQYHLVADSLSERFSKVIGVVIGNIRNPFNTELLSSLQEVLGREGYFVIHHTTDETLESEVKAVAALEAYELGAYVVAPVQENGGQEHLQRLTDAGKILVTIGEATGIETHMVDFDDQQGNREATAYLARLGHRRIACLAGAENSSFARHRITGYVEGLMDNGIPVEESLILRAGDTLAGGYKAAMELLKRKNRPTAMVCFNDLIAIGAYRAAYDLDLRIPDDLSVVGFDDCELAKVLGPPLTTVATHPAQLGKHIAEIILTVQQDRHRRGFLHKRTHPALVERRSVAAP